MPPKQLFRYRTLKLEGADGKNVAPEARKIHAQSLREITVPEIYFSAPENLNDPFEFCVSSNLELFGDLDATIKKLCEELPDFQLVGSKEEKVSRLIEEWLRQTMRRFWNGVACFQEVNDCVLTWAHYGKGHSGICIEYDPHVKQFEAIEKVTYENCAPDASEFIIAWWNKFKGEGEPDLAKKFMWEYLTTKGKPWGYENEWRYIRRIEDDGERLLQLEPAAIKAVYFGINTSEDHRTQLLEAIDNRYPCYQAKLEFGSYEIKFDRI